MQPQFTVLKFLVRYGPYNPGDVAGFPPDVAADLVKLGTCAPYEDKPAKQPSAKKGLPPRKPANQSITKKGV